MTCNKCGGEGRYMAFDGFLPETDFCSCREGWKQRGKFVALGTAYAVCASAVVMGSIYLLASLVSALAAALAE